MTVHDGTRFPGPGSTGRQDALSFLPALWVGTAEVDQD